MSQTSVHLRQSIIDGAARSPAPDKPPGPTRVRYGVLAFLAAMTFVLYLDRLCIGQALPVDSARAEADRVG